MRTLLITGANGFIANRLCRRLAADGYRVRGSLRRVPAGKRDGIDYVASGEIDGGTDWGPLLDGVEAVLHVAAAHQPKPGHPDSVGLCQRANAEGSERLARQAAERGVGLFVQTSSIAVQTALEVEAGAAPSSNIAYAASKLDAERRVAAVAAETGMPLTILRPPVVYGPESHSFAPLLAFLRRGLPLPLAGVKARSSLAYIDNLVDAFAAVLRTPGAVGRVLPVADGPPVPIPELVRLLGAAIGRPARSFPCPEPLILLAARLGGRSVGVRRLLRDRCFEAEALVETQRTLGWTPPYSLAEGLAATLARPAPGKQSA